MPFWLGCSALTGLCLVFYRSLYTTLFYTIHHPKGPKGTYTTLGYLVRTWEVNLVGMHSVRNLMVLIPMIHRPGPAPPLPFSFHAVPVTKDRLHGKGASSSWGST